MISVMIQFHDLSDGLGQILRQLVKRGAHVHPGAVAVEEENGRILSLTNMSQAERDSVAKTLWSPSEAAIRSIENQRSQYFKYYYRILIDNASLCFIIHLLLGQFFFLTLFW